VIDRGVEEVMSSRAERWVAEQEVALLETMYAIDSPVEPEDERELIRVEARKVRLYKRETNSPSDEAISG
jgi:hypothetical protein